MEHHLFIKEKVSEHKNNDGKIQDELIAHISPLGWKHINFLGEYTLDVRNSVTLDSLRPLNTPDT
jgi:hypothetical protein